MNEELEVLKEVTKSLNNAEIAYMITGSIAMNYYAFPRMTRDIDIVLEIQRKDIATIVNLFNKNFYVDQDSIERAVNNHGMFNIIHNEYVIKIDFIVKKTAKFRQIEFQRKRQIIIDKVSMWIVSPEDLILSKLWWAKDSLSEMQMADIENLLDSSVDIDNIYIEKWIEEMNLRDIYRKIINE
ncbi:MAG: nucleotidyl transferase AbiEii/AbiGii toxin family protein [Candidatus Scalindua sp.]